MTGMVPLAIISSIFRHKLPTTAHNYPSLITSFSLSKLTNNHWCLSLVGISSLSSRRKGAAQNISLCHWCLSSVIRRASSQRSITDKFSPSSFFIWSCTDISLYVFFLLRTIVFFLVTLFSLRFATVVSSHSVQQQPLICFNYKKPSKAPRWFPAHGAYTVSAYKLLPLLYISVAHLLLRHLLRINKFSLYQNESLVRCC